jgi:hypothetical protein
MEQNPNLMTRRAALAVSAAAAAVAAMPGAALAVDAPALKIVSVLSRKDGMTHDAFIRHWLDVHGQMAKGVPGVKGFIGSEPIGPESGATSGLLGDIDGIASVWYTDRAGVSETIGAASGKAWLADGDTFIDRGRSHNYFTREHLIVPGKRVDGGVKRTILIVRRPDLSHEQFMAHWLGAHADLARKTPGLAGCVFTEISSPAGSAAGAKMEIDGISESWWTGAGTENGAKIASPQADAWLADGDNFMDNKISRLIISREHVVIPPAMA